MLSKSLLLCLPLLISGTLAAPYGPDTTTNRRAPGGGLVFKAPSTIPAVWKPLAKITAGNPLLNSNYELTFVLTPSSADPDGSKLAAKMTEISLNRGAWLSDDELRGYVGASDAAKKAVQDAAAGLGSQAVFSNLGDKATITTTVGKASKFFNAEFTSYQYDVFSNTPILRTQEYTVPVELASFVSDVFPLANFGQVQRVAVASDSTAAADLLDERALHDADADELSSMLEERAQPASCNPASVTSQCIRDYYGLTSYTPSPASAYKAPAVGIMAYIGQSFSQMDLTTYLKKYRPQAAGYKIPVVTSNGAVNLPLAPGIEAALDTQTIGGIIYPLPSTFYDVGNQLTQGDIFLLTFQNFLKKAVADRPPVISISYGAEESAFTPAQAQSMCCAAQQLTAQGMTIVVSSGDSGVDGNGNEACPPFVPTYPGGCPYILSVGATQNFAPEVMVDDTSAGAGFFSGAGFSNIFRRPNYQATVVPAYINSLNGKYAGEYNASSRAFPDVSAQGSRQNVVVASTTQLVGGTSASAPIWASTLALLNDALKKAGKPSVGYAQPVFYKSASSFTDITSGGSYDCGSTPDGLPAGTGWDASAGLGTPVFSKLRSLYGV